MQTYQFIKIISDDLYERISFFPEHFPREVVTTIQNIFWDNGVFLLPTDTVYGLCSYLSQPSIDKIFEIKQRPKDVALPILIHDVESAKMIVDLRVSRVKERFERLANTFWPGPLTIVMDRVSDFKLDIGGAGDASIGVRISASPIVDFVTRLVGPITATSANLHGQATLTEAQEIDMAMHGWLRGKLAGAILADQFYHGIASTVVNIVHERVKILRLGPITKQQLSESLGEIII